MEIIKIPIPFAAYCCNDETHTAEYHSDIFKDFLDSRDYYSKVISKIIYQKDISNDEKRNEIDKKLTEFIRLVYCPFENNHGKCFYAGSDIKLTWAHKLPLFYEQYLL